MAEKLDANEEAKKYLPLTSSGIVFSVLGLLVFDGALQYVFLIVGAVLCLFAAIKIMQVKKAAG